MTRLVRRPAAPSSPTVFRPCVWRGRDPDAVARRPRFLRDVTHSPSSIAQVHNHFHQGCHLVTRQIYKQRRSAALAELPALAA